MFCYLFLHVPLMSDVQVHNLPTAQVASVQQILFFRVVMTPTLTPVRPGLHRRMLDFSECHCHYHCHLGSSSSMKQFWVVLFFWSFLAFRKMHDHIPCTQNERDQCREGEIACMRLGPSAFGLFASAVVVLFSCHSMPSEDAREASHVLVRRFD